MNLRFLLLPLVLSGAFLVVVFWEKPIWEENKGAKSELVKLRKELDEIKGKNSFAQKAIDDYSKVGQEKVLIANALPEEKEGNVLMAEFFEKAKKAGVFLKSIKIEAEDSLPMEVLGNDLSPDKQKDSVKKDIIAGSLSPEENETEEVGLKFSKSRMELSGSYEEIRNFVLEVEKMNRFLNISLINLKKEAAQAVAEPNSEESAQPEEVIQVTLEATSYWLGSRVEEKISAVGKLKGGLEGGDIGLNFSSDPVLKSILSGKFSLEVIDQFQNSITKEAFQFNGTDGLGGIGKNNLF